MSTTKTKKSESKTYKFEAETGKILDLMINSLYEKKDIFLRELISNSSDACDKLRYESLTNKKLLSNDTDFKIKISFRLSNQKKVGVTLV